MTTTGTAIRNATAALGAGFVEQLRGDELEWQTKGICRTMDPEHFFPEGRDQAYLAKEAKRICLDCPILRECRDWALTRHEEFGVWGGLSDKDRRAIWKKWREGS